jgi:hypothetical protein
LMSVPVLLAANNINAIDPTGGFITGWSADYLLRVTKNGSDTVAFFGRTGEAKRVSAEDKAKMITQLIQDQLAPMKVPEEKLREILHPDDIPDHHPAFSWVAVDRSGRRWVRMSTGDTMTVRFDLFSRDGQWLDQVALANSEWARSAYQTASWSKDHVAVKGESADGRALVRIYRIARKGAP